MSQYNVNAIVGLQWGNEGIAHISDFLSKDADITIKHQSLDNAVSTIIRNGNKFDLSVIPVGVFNPDSMNIISAGSVVDLDKMHKEMEIIQSSSELDADNVFIDERAHIIMPYHEKGIASCYEDKVSGLGLRAADLMDEDRLIKRLEAILPSKQCKLEDIITKCKEWKGWFGDHIIDTIPVVRDSVESGAKIVIEGQSGTMIDNDWGSYPYTTASSRFDGTGIPPKAFNKVYGVAKAYSSCLQNGPFITEDTELKRLDSENDSIRYGWIDAVAVDYSCYINGVTDVCLTNLNNLDSLSSIKVCIGYSINGEYYANLPETRLQENARPIYAEFEGWMEDTSNAHSWSELPEKCKSYIREIEKFLNIPITIITVGPNENQIIERNPEMDK